MNIKRFIKLYINSFRISISNLTIDKSGFFLNIVASALFLLMGPLTMSVVYSVSEGFIGWTLAEVIIFLGTTEFIFGLENFLFGGMPERTYEMVKEGTFDTILLKPINVIGHMITQGINANNLMSVFFGLGILLAGVFMTGYTPGLINVVFFALLMIDSLLIILSFDLIFGGLSFKYYGVENLMDLFYVLFSFTRYPITIYGGLGVIVFTFFLPIGIINYYPSRFLMGSLVSPLLFLELTGVAIAFVSLATIFYARNLKNYSSSGG